MRFPQVNLQYDERVANVIFSPLACQYVNIHSRCICQNVSTCSKSYRNNSIQVSGLCRCKKAQLIDSRNLTPKSSQLRSARRLSCQRPGVLMCTNRISAISHSFQTFHLHTHPCMRRRQEALAVNLFVLSLSLAEGRGPSPRPCLHD